MNAIRVLAAAVLFATPAAADKLDTKTTECVQPMVAFNYLRNRGKVLAFAGKTETGILVSIFSNASGEFTVVSVSVDPKNKTHGQACFALSGAGWTTMEPGQKR